MWLRRQSRVFLFLFKPSRRAAVRVDAKVSAHGPCLETLNAALASKTGHHLPPSGHADFVLRRRRGPGMAFDYNDWQIALFVDTLFLGVYGVTHATVDDAFSTRCWATYSNARQSDLLRVRADNRPGRLGFRRAISAALDTCFSMRAAGRTDSPVERTCAAVHHQPAAGRLSRTQRCPPRCARISGRWVAARSRTISATMREVTVAVVDERSHRNGERHWPDAPTDTYAALGHRNACAGWR